MALLAQINRREPAWDARNASRRKLRLESQGVIGPDASATVVILDLSATGVLIETKVKLSPGEQLKIDIQEVGSVEAAVVWHSGHFFGCEFERRLPKAALSAAILRNAEPARPLPAEMLGRTLSINAPVDEVSDKWPLATRMRLLATLAVAGWAIVGLVVWAVIAVSAVA